jgi:outer membrane protein assembly factor BamA
MTPVTRTILILTLFIALFARPLLAEETAPPRFFIERIEVRNAKRVSRDVIISESRLREGHEYSESDLRDASNRLSRLPFLLSADFALEKGAERGRHVLVITVSETKPFFYSFDIRPVFTNDSQTHVDYTDRTTGTDSEGVVGMRFFVGRRGAVHFGVYAEDFQDDFANDYIAFAVGYTQYDLFGTRAFATLNLKRVAGGYGSVSLSPQLVVGVPLSPNQTLTFGIDDAEFGDELRRIGADNFRETSAQRVVTAAWTYNTTNHPFLPTRGMLLQFKPMVAWVDRSSVDVVQDGPDFHLVTNTRHTRSYIAELSGARYWELSERNSVSAGIVAGAANIDTRSDCGLCLVADGHRQYGVISGGFSHSLWDRNRAKDGDSRLEVNLRLGTRENDAIETFLRQNDNIQQLSASWVRRSPWGSLRLGVGYAW